MGKAPDITYYECVAVSFLPWWGYQMRLQTAIVRCRNLASSKMNQAVVIGCDNGYNCSKSHIYTDFPDSLYGRSELQQLRSCPVCRGAVRSPWRRQSICMKVYKVYIDIDIYGWWVRVRVRLCVFMDG